MKSRKIKWCLKVKEAEICMSHGLGLGRSLVVFGAD